MFSILTAAVVAQQSLPQNIFKPDLKTAPAIAQQTSIASANGYPIARQVFLSSNEILQPQDIRPLPGGLDSIPVFNSNSPEVIRQSGILLSTFPREGKQNPSAHLDYTFQGRFDVFAHHIAKTLRPDTTPTLYNGILIYNPSSTRSITLNVLKAASYLGTPDAPYIDLPSLLDNPLGRYFSGPGGRLTDVLLRGNRQSNWPSRVTLGPKQSGMLMNLPIPVPRPALAKLSWSPISRIVFPSLVQQNPGLNNVALDTAPSSNTRSTFMQLNSSGPVYMAYLAMHAPMEANGQEGIPQKSDWENLAVNGNLVNPRDRLPSPVNLISERFYYGRAAGVSQGSQWKSQVTDPHGKKLTIPEDGQAFSYGLSTLPQGTFGTGQVQSAPMIKRYADTAYFAHGNYGIHYELALPLYNPRKTERQVAISIQTPLKQDIWDKGLRFLRALPSQSFFRGTVRVRYKDKSDEIHQQYFHISQRQGQQGEPIAVLKLSSKESQLVNLDYYYPPDATPPQVLTIQTLADLPFKQQSAYGIQN
jgi:Protein of unknown function (DUF3370)